MGQTEAEYLAAQIHDAREAMRVVAGEMQQSLLAAINVRRWFQEYPVTTTAVGLGAAAAGGLLAYWKLRPKRPERALEQALADALQKSTRRAGQSRPAWKYLVGRPVVALGKGLQKSILGAVTASLRGGDDGNAAAAAGDGRTAGFGQHV